MATNVLVIRNANFSANKVATVEFDVIHTTGLELNDEELTLNSIGQTYQLTYVITPSDSEDLVVFTTSDSSVCTVSENGLITVVGCGTATITATSNGISDSCNISCEIEISNITKTRSAYVMSPSGKSKYSIADCWYNSGNHNYDIYMLFADADSTKERLNISYTYAKDDDGVYFLPDSYAASDNAYRIYSNAGYAVPIVLPNGCTSIVCKALNEHYGAQAVFFKSEVRGGEDNTSMYYYCAEKEKVIKMGDYNYTFAQSTEFDVPSGYDSVCIVWKADTANGAVDFANLTNDQLASFKLFCK